MLKFRIINNKLKSHEFAENGTVRESSNLSEKINEIKRQNQILLDKLMDISKGKWVRLVSGVPNNLHHIQSSVKSKDGKNGPRSLNYVAKKKEAERIDHEN